MAERALCVDRNYINCKELAVYSRQLSAAKGSISMISCTEIPENFICVPELKVLS